MNNVKDYKKKGNGLSSPLSNIETIIRDGQRKFTPYPTDYDKVVCPDMEYGENEGTL